MKRMAPRYMRDFKCIAGDCRHSCCIGWEIDIDEESLENYRRVEGEFGKRLAENIILDGECACFRLDKDERCPFLNACGLCDIYTELGEESLCQICTEHPRFYNEIAGRLEVGVGLCCEAAAKLVLCQEEPFFLDVLEDDGEEEDLFFLDLLEDDGEEEVYDRIEDEILQARRLYIGNVQNGASLVYFMPDRIFKKDWCAFFSSLERLDPKWSEELSKWKNAPVGAWEEPMECFDRQFRNLICYFLYRHFPSADGVIGSVARMYFAFLSYRVVRVLCVLRENCTLADLLDIARMYSAEIEYSEENTERILKELEACLP
jgi:lysine-N-methylase